MIMEKEEIVIILRHLANCPIKGWQDLDEDASQKDVWEAQAEWIKKQLDNNYFN